VKIRPADADKVAKRPPDTLKAILVYGPDQGLVTERINTLTKSVLDDPSDPFRLVDLTDSAVRSDPAVLADEAAAISMMGGRRVVRVRDATDYTAKAVTSFLEDPKGDALVLVAAGELTPRSALRKLFEGAENAGALACYADTRASLEDLIRRRLKEAGWDVDAAALDYLANHLGADRGVTSSELEKLALYMGSGGGTVTLRDAQASVGDSAASHLDDLVDAAAGGDLSALETALSRARQQDANAVLILNALTRHLHQLHIASGRIAEGSPPDAAVKALRPPVHFSRTNAVRRQLGLWSPARLSRAMELVLEADMACKTASMPDFAVASQTLFRIAQAARAQQRG